MASIETNMKFVKELLNSKSINNEQKNTILDLLKIEINNELKKSHNNINLLKKLSKKEYVSDIIYHYPKETVGLLNKFSEDTYLKYTTHIWDIDSESGKEYVDREKFNSNIESEFKDFKFKEILDKNGQNNFYWTIHNFLFVQNIGWQTKPWGEHKLKFGWNNKCLMDYYKSKPSVQPASFAIPSDYLPMKYTTEFGRKKQAQKKKDDETRKLDPNYKSEILEPNEEDVLGPKKIEGRILKYFEDYINLFKNEIEFRGNSLYYFVKDEFANLNSLEYNIEITGLKGAMIYTCTARIKEAIKIIVSNIKARPEKEKSIQVIGRHNSEDNYFEIYITDVGSYSNSSLSSKKIGLQGMGQMESLRNHLRGLCDFSIISVFKNENGEEGNYEVKYLSSERPEIRKDDVQFVKEKIDSAPGFTYKLKFYE